jgi:small subunit ribosomal protein S8
MTNDPVADFINRLKNASEIGAERVSVPFSNLKLAIAERLVAAGFLTTCEKKGRKVKKTLDIALKYSGGKVPVINGVRRVSKPGRRVYRRLLDIHSVRHGKGALILSTPKGIMTDKEARVAKLGGEALFEIW